MLLKVKIVQGMCTGDDFTKINITEVHTKLWNLCNKTKILFQQLHLIINKIFCNIFFKLLYL